MDPGFRRETLFQGGIRPGVTGAIVGARNAEQVDGWLDAAALELTSADMAEIGRAIAETGAGSGPASPAG